MLVKSHQGLAKTQQLGHFFDPIHCKKIPCNMLPNNTQLEAMLLKQLEEIEKQLAHLREEKAALQRLLTKARHKNLQIRDVTRKNSFDRILIENKILERLRDLRGEISAQELYDSARSVSPDLKDNTFRSHLHRLKVRGLIEPSGSQRGYWKAAPTKT